jgi:ABC-type bacteriocin/lantibiotic exporter with double-glycine peptidase domain
MTEIKNNILYIIKNFNFPNIKRDVFFLFIINILNIFLDLLSIALIIPILGILIENYSINNFLYFEKIKNYSFFQGFFSLDQQIKIIIIFIIFFIIIFIKNIFLVFLKKKQEEIGLKITVRANKIFFEKIFNVEFLFIIKEKISNIITYRNRINLIYSFLNSSFTFIFEASYIFLVTSFLIFFYPEIVFFLFSLSLFYLFYQYHLKSKINLASKNISTSERKLYEISLNALNGIKEIRISNYKDFYIKKFYKYLNINENSKIQNSILGYIPPKLIEILLFLSINVFLAVKIVFFSNFDSTYFLQFISIIFVASARILPSFLRLFSAFQSIKYLRFRINNLINFFKKIQLQKIEQISPVHFLESIKLINFNFSYKKTKIFDQFNLTINKKDKILIMGSSGSGKTTLLNIISGLAKSENIYINNKIIKHNFYVSNMSYMSQFPLFIHGTIKENIQLFQKKKSSLKQIENACKKAHIHNFINKLKKKYNTKIYDFGQSFSGGQLQRLALARVILNNPDIILLDECTNSLDSKTEKIIVKNIFKLFADKTIVFVSHKKFNKEPDIKFDKLIYLGK